MHKSVLQQHLAEGIFLLVCVKQCCTCDLYLGTFVENSSISSEHFPKNTGNVNTLW